MAFKLPTFNLRCNISQPDVADTPGIPDAPYRIVDQACQLTYGRRVQVASTGGTTEVGVLVLTMNLLLPAGVDIRGPQDVVTFDMVEVPAGSGRWYRVYGVDDIGKGFSNEHRTASILALAKSWTPPYP
jgi:hypothetical protein